MRSCCDGGGRAGALAGGATAFGRAASVLPIEPRGRGGSDGLSLALALALALAEASSLSATVGSTGMVCARDASPPMAAPGRDGSGGAAVALEPSDDDSEASLGALVNVGGGGRFWPPPLPLVPPPRLRPVDDGTEGAELAASRRGSAGAAPSRGGRAGSARSDEAAAGMGGAARCGSAGGGGSLAPREGNGGAAVEPRGGSGGCDMMGA